LKISQHYIMISNCPNCSYTLQKEFAYCPGCSQKTAIHRLTMHDVLHEAVHYFTHADKGIFGLLKDLVLKNGIVAKEYVEGKRKKYFPPLNFYLLVATIFVIIVNLASHHAPVEINKLHPELQSISDPVLKQKLTGIYKRQVRAIAFMNKYSNIVAMIALPLLSTLYFLFYKKGKYNYTEHLTAGMYMMGFSNLIYVCIFIPISYFLGTRPGNSSFMFIASFMITQAAYCTVFYYRFIGKNSFRSLLKASLVSLFVFFFWMTVSSMLIRFYIQNAFWGLMT
jgi:Protein of unknown function (DUF3667)